MAIGHTLSLRGGCAQLVAAGPMTGRARRNATLRIAGEHQAVHRTDCPQTDPEGTFPPEVSRPDR
jgi:hypothetical protein